MSIVTAVSKNGQIVVAADSLVCLGDSTCVPPANATCEKIVRIGGAILGGAGWGLYDDIFRDHLRSAPAPQLDCEQSIFAFFLDLWKALHERYSFVNDQAQGKDTPFGDLDSTFLIAHQNGIFKVASDMGVSKFSQYFAIGSGNEYALGALHATYESSADAESAARTAVNAAVAYDLHCGGETHVLHVQ